jgi:hypothetical protein
MSGMNKNLLCNNGWASIALKNQEQQFEYRFKE